MLIAVVTRAERVEVELVAAKSEGEKTNDHCEFPDTNRTDMTAEPCLPGPSPIMPELKELYWGGGAFIVLFLLVQFVLYPRVRKGMDERQAIIDDGHTEAESIRSAAKAEAAEYQQALANVRADADERVDAARATLAAEREAALAEVNATVRAQRDDAEQRAAQSRESASDDIFDAACEVTTRTVELAIGLKPDTDIVRRAVETALKSDPTVKS